MLLNVINIFKYSNLFRFRLCKQMHTTDIAKNVDECVIDTH